jgi:SAM-dependent methyltransferase
MINKTNKSESINHTDRKASKEYWNQNIEKWGKLYLEISHSEERFNAPRWLEFLYHRIVTPIEARLMTKRFNLTMQFIEQHIKSNMVAVDLGCGTGIFTVEMLKRGASVIAVDYAQSSLDLTRKAVEELVSDSINRIRYLLADVTYQPLPSSDIVLVMGVTPYVENISKFLGNILPNTQMLYCLFLDPKHWTNRVRKYISVLNVRNLHFYDSYFIDELYRKHEWNLIHRKKFASGYLDLAKNNKRIK